jgi:hypothetical protein
VLWIRIPANVHCYDRINVVCQLWSLHIGALIAVPLFRLDLEIIAIAAHRRRPILAAYHVAND